MRRLAPGLSNNRIVRNTYNQEFATSSRNLDKFTLFPGKREGMPDFLRYAGELLEKGETRRFSRAWRTGGTYQLEQEFAPLPGVNDDATFDCAGRINASCGNVAEWRHIASASYARDWWSVAARWRRIREPPIVEGVLATGMLNSLGGYGQAGRYIDGRVTFNF